RDSWESNEAGLPVVEATAEEMMVEVDVPISAPTYARQTDVALADAAEQSDAPPPPPEAPEMPPGLNYTGTPPTVDVPMEEGGGAFAEASASEASSVEMFPPDEGAASYAGSDETLPPPG